MEQNVHLSFQKDIHRVGAALFSAGGKNIKDIVSKCRKRK